MDSPEDSRTGSARNTHKIGSAIEDLAPGNLLGEVCKDDHRLRVITRYPDQAVASAANLEQVSCRRRLTYALTMNSTNPALCQQRSLISASSKFDLSTSASGISLEPAPFYEVPAGNPWTGRVQKSLLHCLANSLRAATYVLGAVENIWALACAVDAWSALRASSRSKHTCRMQCRCTDAGRPTAS